MLKGLLLSSFVTFRLSKYSSGQGQKHNFESELGSWDSYTFKCFSDFEPELESCNSHTFTISKFYNAFKPGCMLSKSLHISGWWGVRRNATMWSHSSFFDWSWLLFVYATAVATTRRFRRTELAEVTRSIWRSESHPSSRIRARGVMITAFSKAYGRKSLQPKKLLLNKHGIGSTTELQISLLEVAWISPLPP